MYSGSQLESATTFCLINCQVTKQLPRKKSVPRALACVDVAGKVVVVVADEVCGARRLDEVQTEVERASDIAEDALDSLLMLHRRPLHESADEPDGERQIRASVHQVAQTAHEPPVVWGSTSSAVMCLLSLSRSSIGVWARLQPAILPNSRMRLA